MAEDILEVAFQQAQVGLCLLDPDERIIKANAEWFRSTGLAPENALGRDILELFPEERGLADQIRAELQAGRTVPIPRHRVQHDGEENWWEGSISQAAMEAGTGYLITLRDVTSLVQIEHFRLLAENSLDIIFRFHFKPSPAFDYVSPAAEGITGYTVEEHYANPGLIRSLVHPEDWIKLEPYMKGPSPDTGPIALRWVRKDGRVIWVEQHNSYSYDDAGELATVEGIVRDITAAKEAEEALRASEEKYRNLFESHLDAILVADDEGRYVDANPQASVLTGYSREELLGMSISNITPQEMREIEMGMFREFMAIGWARGEKPVLRKDGQIIDVEFSASKAVPGRYQSVQRDITARKRAEAALRESEERFRKVFEEGPLGMSIARPDFRFVRVNSTFCRMVEYSEEELTSLSLIDITHPDDIDEDVGLAMKLLDGQIPSYQMDKRYITRSGGVVWVRLSASIVRDGEGRPLYFIGMLEDITQQLTGQAERERLLSEVRRRAAELDATINAIADGVFIYDPSGQPVVINRAAEQMMGVTMEGYRLPMPERMKLLGMETPDGKPLSEEDSVVRRAMRGETIQGFLIVFHPPNGKTLWGSVSAAPIHAADGALLGAVLTVTDVTRLRELQEYQQEMVRIISHDLRNPLTPMIGWAGLLLKQLSRSKLETEARGAEAIIQSAERMNSMIQELIDSSQLELGRMELHPEPTDLCALIASVARRMEGARENGRLLVDCPERVPEGLLDRERIQRVLENLISNALKYSPEGTPVVVSAGLRTGSVVVSVSDQGVGIPTEQQPLLFDRFFRARTGQQTEGLGLGLYISRLIVEAHGGRIWVDSREGQGSTFTFSLPAAATRVS